MSFRLANVDGRATLVDADGNLHDVNRVSEGTVAADPLLALQEPDRLHALADDLRGRIPVGFIDEVRLGPPVPRPGKILAVGLNYRDHAAEAGAATSAAPVIFAKFPSCTSGPYADIPICGDSIDYEAEVVVVMGRRAAGVPASRAWEHVAGLTAGQDVSDRELQFAATPPHFDLAKSRDGYGPIGPLILSPDSFADRDDVEVECVVNGELRQRASTGSMVFSIPQLIEYVSAIVPLEPGDLLFTGTPAGVGMATGRFLRPGDVVETRIGGGRPMVNRCVPAPTRKGQTSEVTHL